MSSNKIPNWYHVKYRQIKTPNGGVVEGKWKFGKLEHYGKEAESHWPDNWCIEDAITGQPYLVPAKTFEVVEIKSGEFVPHVYSEDEVYPIFDDEYHKFVAKETNKALKKSRSLKGCVKGKVFNLGVADGYAYYMVTSTGKRNVNIEWRDFGCDSYFDQILGGGGSFPRHIVEPLIERQEAMEKMFSKHKKEKAIA